VKSDRTAESRPVVTGARLDQDLVIEKGVAAGETVVVEGQLRLAPGMKVQIRDNSGAPTGGSRRRRQPQ
jgi:membrane fusion protein, multidrug efflux system